MKGTEEVPLKISLIADNTSRPINFRAKEVPINSMGEIPLALYIFKAKGVPIQFSVKEKYSPPYNNLDIGGSYQILLRYTPRPLLKRRIKWKPQ